MFEASNIFSATTDLDTLAANIIAIGKYLFFIPFGVIILELMGLIFAFPAAIICGSIARIKKLDACAYAIHGASYSMLLLLPFFYALSKLLFNWGIFLRIIAVSGYAFIYTIWIGIILLDVTFVISFTYEIIQNTWYALHIADISLGLSAIVMLVTNVYGWKWTFTNLRRASAGENGSISNRDAYLLPFAILLTSSVIHVVLLVVTIILSFAGQ